MWYHIYEAQSRAGAPFRAVAEAALRSRAMLNSSGDTAFMRRSLAALELASRARLTHKRPPFDIGAVKVEGRTVKVTEEVALSLPFGDLLRFRKESDAVQPKALLVAPLSGHFATLLRNTVRTMLQDHDVYVTDWTNARDVPLSAGRFGFEDYVDYLIAFLEHLGPDSHMVAVCQPAVQSLAATALMAEDKHPCAPASLTLMAGPIDCSANPTQVNELAAAHPIDWFRANLISAVPFPNAGWGRRVYPGFVQVGAFMSMNPDRHITAHQDLYRHLAEGNDAEAEKIKTFYDEYFAVLDLTEEFYIETVAWVFQEMRLARGTLTHRGRKVNPAAIRRTALLTVEGERDDICSVGQTAAAHDLCTRLRPHIRHHHLQPGVGHYGVFSGKRWETQIYPIVRNVIIASQTA
jgi:polyhydroxyalkanoate depolymerase